MSAVDPTIRDIVEAHGQAVADGNMQRALEDFTEAGAQHPNTGPTVAQLPQPVKTATVKRLDQQSDGSYVAHVRYGGDEKSTTVRSVWEHVGDRPYITSVSVVDE
jgi:hypothetical protein